MLTDVNFTIIITDSMGNVNNTIDIIASDCVDDTLTCGDYLTEFNYTSIDGLEINEPYNVSITTSINETNTTYTVDTPVVTIIENTTIPGKDIISYLMCILLVGVQHNNSVIIDISLIYLVYVYVFVNQISYVFSQTRAGFDTHNDQAHFLLDT